MNKFQAFSFYFALVAALIWSVSISQEINGDGPAKSVPGADGQPLKLVKRSVSSGPPSQHQFSRIFLILIYNFFFTQDTPECGSKCSMSLGGSSPCNSNTGKCSIENCEYGLPFLCSSKTEYIPCCGDCTGGSCCNFFGTPCKVKEDCCNSTKNVNACDSVSQRCCLPYYAASKCSSTRDCCNGICLRAPPLEGECCG